MPPFSVSQGLLRLPGPGALGVLRHTKSIYAAATNGPFLLRYAARTDQAVAVPLLRTAFFGSPAFAVPTLHAVLLTTECVAVVTQPDKPVGRGQKVQPPPVKAVAEAAGVPVLQPRTLRTDEARAQLQALDFDVGVVVAYGKILPQSILDLPRYGFLNVHGSLLPRWRGAAPIQWSVLSGDAETGVSLMKLDAGMDTGPVALLRRTAVAAEETAGELATRLSGMGAELMRVALERLVAGELAFVPQDDAGATLAPMLTKDHGRVDWTRPATRVKDQIRGVDPWPGAWTLLGSDAMKLWRARVTDGAGAPGTVLRVEREGVVVACGEGAVALSELQLPGKKRLDARAFAAGRAIAPGQILS